MDIKLTETHADRVTKPTPANARNLRATFSAPGWVGLEVGLSWHTDIMPLERVLRSEGPQPGVHGHAHLMDGATVVVTDRATGKLVARGTLSA